MVAHTTDPALLGPASNLGKRFREIDSLSGFTTCWEELKKAETRNFVVDFSDSEALCATDLSTSEIKSLLNSSRSSTAETRWINFWGGDLEGSKESIELIVKKYGLAPRLISLLCSKASQNHTEIRRIVKDDDQDGSKSTAVPSNLYLTPGDAEKAAGTKSEKAAKLTKRLPIDLQKTTFGEIVDDIWHFCSVDWGQGYLYVGYNSLFSIPELEVDSGPDKPTGKRIWTSLILCWDGTVISVSEKAFPNPKDYHSEILQVVRRNTLNVFQHLSKISKTEGHQNDLMTIKLRNFDADPMDNHCTASLNGASLLFYYLFDDWITSYSLAARKEHPYGNKLEDLRLEMLEKADIELVECLHSIGRQIAVLKRIYQSFELIINRIIERQRLLPGDKGEISSLQTNANGSVYPKQVQSETTASNPTSSIHHSGQTLIGVRLSEQAMFRFERLLDRIRLYALSTIDEYIAEKDTLVTMNFNLIALKDSQATEKLTRVTVLLSKIAAIFLPLSLLTSYMSMSIPGLVSRYTATTYWVTFVVITALSIMFLIIFGLASDTVEGRTIYKSLTRTIWTKGLKAKRQKFSSTVK